MEGGSLNLKLTLSGETLLHDLMAELDPLRQLPSTPLDGDAALLQQIHVLDKN